MNEHVDIVNEKDVAVGQTTKHAAHQDGTLHRCVIAEIIDSAGNWMLVKQAGDRQDASQFVSPVGGHVQAGETIEAALKREAFEEAGIKDFTFRFIGKVVYYREVIGRKENHYFELFEIRSDAPITLNHESVAYESFSRDALRVQLRENPEKFGDAFHFVIDSFYPDMRTG